MSERSSWHTRAERGSAFAIRFLVGFYRRVGRSAAGLLLLYPIVTYFFVTSAGARRASRRWLERVYATPAGARALGTPPGTRQVFQHILEFGRGILDRVGFWLGRVEDFELRTQGMEHLDRLAERGTGALILGSHLGSWDVMRLVAEVRSATPVNVLMYTRHAPLINTTFETLRRASGVGIARVRIVEVDPGSFQHTLDARAAVARGEVVAILADRAPPQEAARVCRVDFLGGTIALPQGPIRLAALLGCPVLLMTGLRVAERTYEVRVEPFAERIEADVMRDGAALRAHCQRYADQLADQALRAPYQWFNFYDAWIEDE